MWILTAQQTECVWHWQFGINQATAWSPDSREENGSHFPTGKVTLKQETTLKMQEAKSREEIQQKGPERLLKQYQKTKLFRHRENTGYSSRASKHNRRLRALLKATQMAYVPLLQWKCADFNLFSAVSAQLFWKFQLYLLQHWNTNASLKTSSSQCLWNFLFLTVLESDCDLSCCNFRSTQTLISVCIYRVDPTNQKNPHPTTNKQNQLCPEITSKQTKIPALKRAFLRTHKAYSWRQCL